VTDPRLSINPTCTPAQTIAEDLALARRLGLRRVTLAAAKLESAGWTVADAVARVRDGGFVAVDSILQPAWFALAEPATWPALQERLLTALQFADGLEAPLQLTTGGAGGLAYESACDAFAEAIAPVAGAARSRGVALLLEPTRTQFAHVSFVHTLRDALALLASLGLDARVVFDVTHCWWEPGLDALLATRSAAIGSVHLADLALREPLLGRRVPGDGDLRLAEMLTRLLHAGYDGPVEIEVLGPAIDSEGVEVALARSVAAATALLEGGAAGRRPASRARLSSSAKQVTIL
jgi:sugar phosphate isomerase/epimerase